MKKSVLKKLYTCLAALWIGLSSLCACGCDSFLSQLESALNGALDGLLSEYYEDATVDETYVYTRTVGGGDYYYNYLSAKQQQFYKKLRIDMDKFFAGDRQLKSYTYEGEEYGLLGNYLYSSFGLTAAEGRQAFEALYQDCPQYYAYDGVYMLYDDTSLAPVLSVDYESQSLRNSVDAKIASSVRTVEGRLQGKTTDFEKFQEIYQYVMQQVEYEYDEYGNPSGASHVGTIVGVVDGDRRTNSVCAGYAYAITYLSNIFGVECISVANEALNHAWNMVKIDGGWYHADATNEDSNNGVDLFLCSEKVFWEFFEYPAPAYDKGEADTVGRVGIIPDVLDDLCYSRFEYKTVDGGLAVSGAIVNQYLLRIPSTYAGKKVVAIAENFTYTAGNLSDLVLPVSVVSVEVAAFSWKPLSHIFYEGTPEQFAAITIASYNTPFKDAAVYYYSETPRQGDTYTYWYYGEDGLPCIW